MAAVNIFYLMLAVYAVNYAATTKNDLSKAQDLFHQGLQCSSRGILQDPDTVAEKCGELQNIGTVSAKKSADPLAQAEAFNHAMAQWGDPRENTVKNADAEKNSAVHEDDIKSVPSGTNQQ